MTVEIIGAVTAHTTAEVAHADIGAGVEHLRAAGEAGNGENIVHTAGLGAGDGAANINLIALPDPEIRGGDDGTLVAAYIGGKNLILSGIIGKGNGAVAVGYNNGIGAVLIGGKLEIHGDLVRIAFGPVHGGAEGDDQTAVDIGAQVRVQTGIGGGIGRGDHNAAVNYQIAVGVDTIALRAKTGDDMDDAAVDGGNGNAVLIGVDAIIHGTDVDGAAIDGQVKLRIQTLVFGGQVQRAGAEHVHGHIGIESAVLLPQLLFAGLVLVDSGNVGAEDGILALQNQIGTGSGGIDRGRSGIRGPVAVAFVNIQEQNGGGNGAGDVRIVQNQLHYGGFIVTGILAKINPKLTGRQRSADTVGTGGGDIHNGMGGGLFGGVLILSGSLTVGIAAVVGIPVLVIDNIPGGKDGVRFGAAVYQNAVI